jgi:beta-lactam-binding protein with PASTA domain
MPTLTGKRLGDVERTLVDLNLQLAEVSYIANDEAESGTVISQSIESGKQVRMGSKLALEVAVPAALKDSPTRSINLRITVPTGPEQQRVKIKFFDALGPQEDYNQMHARGHTIERTIAIEGPATIQIFINDMNEPYRVEKL